MHGDALGILLSVLLIALCVGASILVSRYGKRRLGDNCPEVARKIVHIGVSNWFFIYVHVFETDVWPIIGLVSFAVMNAIANSTGLLGKLMDQKSFKRNWGLVEYPLSIVLLILIKMSGFGDTAAFGCAILGMGYGDGISSLAGRYFGSRKISKHNSKTVAGCIAMALATFVTTLVIKLSYGASSPGSSLLCAVVTSCCASLVEAFTPFGLDNISVPLAIYLISELL